MLVPDVHGVDVDTGVGVAKRVHERRGNRDRYGCGAARRSLDV